MTLKARLTLVVLLVVLGVLASYTLTLRFAWEGALLRVLDQDLGLALDLAETLLAPDPEDGVLRFAPAQSLEVLPHLLPGLVLVLAQGGELLDAFGRLPPPAVLEAMARGETTGFRTRARVVGEAWLIAALPTSEVRRSLYVLDLLLLALLPLTALLAWGVSRALLGKGLEPLTQAAQQALRLAQLRAWDASLPERATPDEVGQLVRAVNHLLQALGEVVRSERRFHEEASHALRTPLSVLRIRLERALDMAEGPLYGELLPLREELERLQRMVERLLQLARAEGGALDRGPVCLDQLVFEEAEAFRELCPGLVVETPEEPLWVKGDEELIRVALKALLENALVHGGGPVRVRVYAKGEEVVLEVEDRGPGLSGDAERLFTRFAKGRRSRGSGLGLALVDAVARWHGGRRWAREKEGGGAVFGLALPLGDLRDNGSRYYLTKSDWNT